MRVASASLARFVLVLALAGCAAPKPAPVSASFEDDSAVVVPTDQLSAPPFSVLQRVHGKLGTQEIAFECTVRFEQGKLSLTGMTPYGTRAFLIEQVGSDVREQA